MLLFVSKHLEEAFFSNVLMTASSAPHVHRVETVVEGIHNVEALDACTHRDCGLIAGAVWTERLHMMDDEFVEGTHCDGI
jgi:tetrahydromethanopterin S-methyltransferase subunit F